MAVSDLKTRLEIVKKSKKAASFAMSKYTGTFDNF